MTVLPELLPIMLNMIENNEIGTINLTNPGTISHNEIMELFKKYVDKDLEYNNFTIEEQNSILKSERSNNKLNTSKLQMMYPDVNNIYESVSNLIQKWNNTD